MGVRVNLLSGNLELCLNPDSNSAHPSVRREGGGVGEMKYAKGDHKL